MRPLEKEMIDGRKVLYREALSDGEEPANIHTMRWSFTLSIPRLPLPFAEAKEIVEALFFSHIFSSLPLVCRRHTA